MSLYTLTDSATNTSIDVDPEYDLVRGPKKIEDRHRSVGGTLYTYKWGDYDTVEFSMMYVSSADAYQLNEWYRNNTPLFFIDNSDSNVTVECKMSGRKSPVGKPIRPYRDQFKCKVVLEAVS